MKQFYFLEWLKKRMKWLAYEQWMNKIKKDKYAIFSMSAVADNQRIFNTKN